MSNSAQLATQRLGIVAGMASAMTGVFGNKVEFPTFGARPPRLRGYAPPTSFKSGTPMLAAECGRFMKKPGRQEHDIYGRALPHAPRQLHVIQHTGNGRIHHWCKGDVDLRTKLRNRAYAGGFGRCTLEWVNGFGQVVDRVRLPA